MERVTIDMTIANKKYAQMTSLTLPLLAIPAEKAQGKGNGKTGETESAVKNEGAVFSPPLASPAKPAERFGDSRVAQLEAGC